MPTASSRPATAEPPLALLLATDGTAPPHASRLERAGFALRYCRTPGEARKLAASATLCDAALLDGDDLSQRSMEQLVRDRLETLLDRLGEEPVAGLHALVMREVERGLLRLVLERCHGHRSEAARQLGLHRNTLRQKVAELGLETPAPRKRAKRR
jgi:Fis family transcriptional regulator, factor for inversion stimulation protein